MRTTITSSLLSAHIKQKLAMK